VEADRPSGTLAFVFFRHDEGSWCVFPPEYKRPTMNIVRTIASPATSPDCARQFSGDEALHVA
jgi:hypothetical protein